MTRKSPVCRLCASPLSCTFADLGMSPLANSYIEPGQINAMEAFFPLHVWVCGNCFLVQLEEFETPQHIFGGDYAYFSSFSTSWLQHARLYCEQMMQRFKLDASSRVVEVASNDGYLLQYFHQAGVPVLGIEPASNCAAAARKIGVDTREIFFGAGTATQLAKEGYSADLLLGNNVLAHVPDLLSFVEGLSILLKPHGVITLEFPHLLQMMSRRQFDTIYHEHFSYLSLKVVETAFHRFGLEVFRVEELGTHGGSLRVFGKHASDDSKPVEASVAKVRDDESQAGFGGLDAYRAFAGSILQVKCDLLEFLIDAHRAGKRVVGYGAPAKGNTLLNYCGVGPELLEYTVDLSPHKQGRYLPGVLIPIHAPDKILADRPDYVVILPWNLRDEISSQLAGIREWGGRFVVPIPSLEVF
jgi:SAM-dependent methyltransferase